MHFEMYPTIITPFENNGSIDYAGLEKLIAMFAYANCDGIFAVCQSSEMFFLSDDEKLELAKKSIEFCRTNGIKCVVSGHTQDNIETQVNYLKKLEKLNPDAIILVSNRLAREDESDDVAIANLQHICGLLSRRTHLGIYECPYPYSRPLTPALIQAMMDDGRFDFIKDTSCQTEVICRRLAQMKGSGIGLYNANAATLLHSIGAGAAGYSGIQINLMPEFFTLLKEACQQQNCSRIQHIYNHIAGVAYVECQNYPANAKYLLMKRGLISTTITRNGKPPMSESQKKEMDAFEAMNHTAIFQFLKHESIQLLFGYNTFFPECHASTVLPLDDGRVLVAYFAGTGEKNDDTGIWLSERVNGAWLAPRLLAKINDTPHWNPVIYKDGDAIRVLFKVGKEIPDWLSYLTTSLDGGQTWSLPKAINEDNPAGGPVRNKPIILSDGRMLAPNSDEINDVANLPEKWLPCIDVSTDGGATFQRLAQIPVNLDDANGYGYIAGAGAIQPTLWESQPGHVHALLRTSAGRIYRSDSLDSGNTWCMAYQTNLPNNNSGIDLVNVNGVLYLVMNPVTGDWAARTPIVVMRSTDNGEHFEYFRILENMLFDESHNRTAEFSYPAIVEKDNTLYISFTHNRRSVAFCNIKLH